jgi:CRP-like cAMP-binding protein
MQGPRHLSREAIETWKAHRLAATLADSDGILDDAVESRIAAGQPVYRINDLTLVVSGLIRVYLQSWDGREITLRYVAAGDLLGLPMILAPEAMITVPSQAANTLTDCHLVRLSPRRFRAVVEREAANMWPLFFELAALHEGYIDMLAENFFLPVRARVARHLLDLAARDGRRLVVHVSQQQIADAIGSVREVVSRALVWMRDEGMLHRDGTTYVLDDPARLHVVAVGHEADS